MTKDGGNVLFGKEIIISKATPKISNNIIKPKQLHIVNTDKTRSKRTRSQFPFQTLLTMIPKIYSHHVKLSLYSVIEPVAKEHINSYHETSPWITERSALSITR